MKLKEIRAGEKFVITGKHQNLFVLLKLEEDATYRNGKKANAVQIMGGQLTYIEENSEVHRIVDGFTF